jgi:isopentenyl-diphosphate delta-isomerase
MVDADLLTIHLNVAQELVQTDGDRRTDSLLAAIAAVVESSPVPVIVKETGAGMSRADVCDLAAIGVGAVDVGGAGGTSFVAIEAARAQRVGDAWGARLGETLADWGVPTAAAVLEARGQGLPIIATGGIRTGLDMAKALALGADLVGVGQPVMVAAQAGLAALLALLETLIEELRVAAVLSGARRPVDLRSTPPVLTGRTRDWVRQRKLLD